jgi:hypothetical protein
LPARSPMPLTQHSTWRAPAATADSELATASPRSSWQCGGDDDVPAGDHLEDAGDDAVVLDRHRVADGVGHVEHGGAGLDGAAMASRRKPGRCGWRPRRRTRRPVASSAQRPTPVRICSSTSARVIRSLCSRWMSLVAMKTCRRGRTASLIASQAASMSPSRVRQRRRPRRAPPPRDLPHRLVLARAGDREARLDDVHAQESSWLGDEHLLVAGHRAARGLLPVSQGSVENSYDVSVLHGVSPQGAGPHQAASPRCVCSGSDSARAGAWDAGLE